MNFTQRQIRIFRILLDLEPGQAISAGELASRIRVSRRTLFRELESVRMILDHYDLTLATRPGLSLQGDKKRSGSAAGFPAGTRRSGQRRKAGHAAV